MKSWKDGRAGLLLPLALLLPWTHSSLAYLSISSSFLLVTCGRGISGRSQQWENISAIMGGEPANITQFPWHVGIMHYGNHLCGGTILNEWWILTASHCFDQTNNSNLVIIHGKDDLNSTKLVYDKVNKLITHPKYDDLLLDNDIALLLLESPLNLSINSRVPICISEVSDLVAWSNCWVVGWGVTNTSSPKDKSAKLRKVQVELFRTDWCSLVVSLVTKNMLCAGSRTARKDACQGDSGGGLFCNKKKNITTWYQVGIVSWGMGCGQNLPGIYTKVSGYLKWISRVTAKAGKPYMYVHDSVCPLVLSCWPILFLYLAVFLLTW
ncbi:serine protease 52-like [Acomys russatus]|uniref:serine protease 52-like n=1 Tax=Acomys russatus TaxID=60746 RepID=UPI0021E2DE7F|nr:serine protease 52-like [Acomys russatus]